MKRLTGQNLGVIMAIALTGAVGATAAVVIWGAATTQGTCWLLAQVTSLSGGTFSVQKVEGKLLDHLLLTGVRITLTQQKGEVDRVELRWKPLPLSAGTIAIQELSLSGVRIQDEAPSDNKPPLLVWPKVPRIMQLFDGGIARLQATNIRYRHLQEQPQVVTEISTSVTWRNDIISISELKVATPSGRITGSISAGFTQPTLTADLTIIPAHPIAKMDTFSLQIRPDGSGPEQLTGTVTISGTTGKLKQFDLGGVVGMERDALNLRHFSLTRSGQLGMVTADGSLTFTAAESVLSVQATLAGLDLAPELDVATNLSGTMIFSGTPDHYRGAIILANKTQGWQAATVSAVYNGTQTGITLAPLTATVIDGSLAGNLTIDWRNGVTLRGTINGRNLNPARIAPDWKGAANFRVTGSLVRTDNGTISGSLNSDLLNSRLHGQTVTGALQADFTDTDLSVARLELQGNGFELHASGKLNQRLTVTTRISDLSRLVPGTAGAVRCDGWVRRHDRHLSGAITGTGNNLSINGTEIAAANLAAQLDQEADSPFTVTASLRDVVHGAYAVDSVTVAANGTLPHHVIHATAHSDSTEADLNLSAGYTGTVWKGKIVNVTISDTIDPWLLATPAAFTISPKNVFLSPLTLATGVAERIEVTADLGLKPLRGHIRTTLRAIDLQRLKPWFPVNLSVEGSISGQVNGVLLARQRIKLDGTAAVSGGSLRQKNGDEELDISFTAATASWDWHENSLTGALLLSMTDYGQAQVNVQLPIPARFPVAVNRSGQLRAALVGNFKENGILSALFPESVRKSSGQLDADLAIGGTWEVPHSEGTVQLAKGEAYLPAAGIHLQNIQLSAHLEKNIILIDSFRAISGPGHIEGTALITLADWKPVSYHGAIRGENFQAVYFPEIRILSTPQLNFEGTPQQITVRGEVKLPELHMDGVPSGTGIAPSKDVIREGRGAPISKNLPFALDIQIRLLLGEQVFVRSGGIDARLGGAMDLSLSNLDRITGSGEINVVKGHYRTYGANLEIVRGRLYFAGGPITQPTLDFLALRTVGDVRAGVTVAGTLQKPITKLYSEPAMPDVDVLGYIVVGHPLDSNSEQANLATQAAGTLLSSRLAADMEDQVKNRLGLSILEIQGGVGGTTGSMGYKPLQVTAPGTIPATQQPGITETMFTVGKYLTPELYISYGKSLFTGSNLFLLRYDIFKQWQIETQTGNESGVDLFYKLEFK